MIRSVKARAILAAAKKGLGSNRGKEIQTREIPAKNALIKNVLTKSGVAARTRNATAE
jgi:hypothetical protein